MVPIKCSVCQWDLSTDAESCPRCGHRTPIGELKNKHKRCASGLVFALIVMLVGAFLFIYNWDYWDYWNSVIRRRSIPWERYSTELKQGIILFVVGMGLFVGGFVDALMLWIKSAQLKSKIATYVKHGDLSSRRPDNISTGYSPMEGYVQTVAKEACQGELANPNQRAGYCGHCGQPMSDKQAFCGYCGQKR